MTESVAGHTIVVLGGTSGIGLAVAQKSLAAGADVVVTGRDPERLHDALATLEGARGATFDVDDDAALAEFFSALERPARHVFVSAGGPLYGRLADLDAAQAAEAIGRSVGLMIRLSQVAPASMESDGSLTFMSGTGSRRPALGLTAIAATVAARSASAANLALEIAPIRVNLIASGFVDTPLSARLLGEGLDDRRRQLARELPVRRVIQAADVADLALHLMVNTALTGAVYDIDGGQQLLPTTGG